MTSLLPEVAWPAIDPTGAIIELIRLAMDTQRRLPDHQLASFFHPFKVMWPDIAAGQGDYPDETTVTRLPATREGIAALDTVEGWLWALEPDERIVVALRGMDCSFGRIVRIRKKMGRRPMSREHHRQTHRRAIAKIAEMIGT